MVQLHSFFRNFYVPRNTHHIHISFLRDGNVKKVKLTKNPPVKAPTFEAWCAQRFVIKRCSDLNKKILARTETPLLHDHHQHIGNNRISPQTPFLKRATLLLEPSGPSWYDIVNEANTPTEVPEKPNCGLQQPCLRMHYRRPLIIKGGEDDTAPPDPPSFPVCTNLPSLLPISTPQKLMALTTNLTMTAPAMIQTRGGAMMKEEETEP